MENQKQCRVEPLKTANFTEKVLKSRVPVLVDFWASWCPPCKMLEPILENIAAEYYPRLKVAKINVDQNPDIADKFNITGVPTIILFNSSDTVSRKTGAQSKEQLENMIASTIGKI